MEDQNNDLELIDLYLEGELNKDDHDALEERLRVDAEFKALFDDVFVLTKGLEKLRSINLKKRFKALDANLGNPLEAKRQKGKVVIWPQVIRWAAVLIIGAFSIVYLSSRFGGQNNQIYKDFFKTYANVVVPTQRGGDSLTLINRAFTLYDEGIYSEAAPVFEEVLVTEQAEYVQFYYAMVLLALEDWQGAKSKLEYLVLNGENFQNQSKWYLSLTYIRMKEEEKSVSLLKSLSDGETSYAEASEAILKRIN